MKEQLWRFGRDDGEGGNVHERNKKDVHMRLHRERNRHGVDLPCANLPEKSFLKNRSQKIQNKINQRENGIAVGS